ncbi:trans-2,3-dihydro-3-hydroxyanthranilate isomerase [Halorubrum aquaticum]|uniref:Trans-2,3-dihydro-3-hydroxyanthranilate isomerase n=1 Tax=Halorubrum aquaticum TaxID=387340 RepID=A0A1I3A2Q7_9EURY|nr:PhzF family phenazine biosynthesis protein [Halorubrum aquaticum]SFH43601.1 trans-2,3-dihydro-3-hydroxyanthranilate isomerase [Halorubrum aquaticum]
MSTNRVHFVDVFAQGKYTGNQLAVVRDASNLSTDEMLAFTRETNFSEATFIESSDATENGYDVRIFDPAEEIPFAGHPTLGTAFVIREHLRDDLPEEVVLNLGVGEIPVWVEDHDGDETYWMRQIQPTFEDEFPPELFAEILGLDVSDVDDSRPIRLVSTGLPTVVVPLNSLDAVRRAETQPEPYYDRLIDSHGNVNVLVFSTETSEDNDLHVRVFADCSGVPEDPATGSSNGCLAAYLVEHDYFDTDDIEVTVEQGYEMGRPSLLRLRASKGPEGIDVEVGGRVSSVLEGRLH